MTTSKESIKQWLSRTEKGQTRMIVFCDTYDHSDYPVYVNEDEDVKEIIKKRDGRNMCQLMEVYNLSMDIEKQLDEHRAFNY